MKTRQNADSHREITNHLRAAAILTEAFLEEDISRKRSLFRQVRPSRPGDRIDSIEENVSIDMRIGRLIILDLGKAAMSAFQAGLPERLNFQGRIVINHQPTLRIAADPPTEIVEREPGNISFRGGQRCPFPVAFAYLEQFENSSKAEREVLLACRNFVVSLNDFAQLSSPEKREYGKSSDDKNQRALHALAEFTDFIGRWESLELFDAEQREQITSSAPVETGGAGDPNSANASLKGKDRERLDLRRTTKQSSRLRNARIALVPKPKTRGH